MTHGTAAIMTLRGRNLALDRHRRDALATYAEIEAAKHDKPAQQWVRETWGLKDYEAKHLLRGNASEATWERILKSKGRHGGWAVALPIIGAVIGQDVADHFAAERDRIADERARHEAEEARITALERHARERLAAVGLGAREGALRPRGPAGEPRVAASRVGHQQRR